MQPIVNLPWYDSPLSAQSLDDFWRELRQQLTLLGFRDLPSSLSRGENLIQQWQDPALLLSQCCGPDLFTESTSGVSCLGRPIFSDIECDDGYYYSHIVSLGLPPKNPRLAINSPTSWSGHFALQRWLTQQGIERSSCIVSGSHQASLDLLRSNAVDLIAVDAHYWSLLDTEGASIVDRSQIAPTPPFITNLASESGRQALFITLEKCLAAYGHRLGISGLIANGGEIYREYSNKVERGSLLHIG